MSQHENNTLPSSTHNDVAPQDSMDDSLRNILTEEEYQVALHAEQQFLNRQRQISGKHNNRLWEKPCRIFKIHGKIYVYIN